MSPAEIIEGATEEGVLLALLPSGSISAKGDPSAIDCWLPAIKQSKAAIIAELQLERWRGKVLTMLRENPDIRYTIEVLDANTDPVIVSIGIRTLLELATKGDWRLVSTFSRPVALDDFLLILKWDVTTWADTGVVLAQWYDLHLLPRDQEAFQDWLNDEATTTWLADLEKIVDSAVTSFQVKAGIALSQAVLQPGNIHLEN